MSCVVLHRDLMCWCVLHSDGVDLPLLRKVVEAMLRAQVADIHPDFAGAIPRVGRREDSWVCAVGNLFDGFTRSAIGLGSTVMAIRAANRRAESDVYADV